MSSAIANSILRMLSACASSAVRALPNLGDARAEALLDVRDRVLRVLGYVVQQRRLDRLGIEPEVGERARDGERMADVGLAAGALLRTVRLDREEPRFADASQVRLRVVRRQHFLELALRSVQRAPAVAERKRAAYSLSRASRAALLRGAQGLDRHLKVSVP
jgi:hypothetical protein